MAAKRLGHYSSYPTLEVNGITVNAIPDRVYVVNNGSRVNITLPEYADVGNRIEIIGKGIGGWKIEQRAGQYIRIDERGTTVGINGSVQSTVQYDGIVVKCTTPNIEWTATGVIGNLMVI